MPPNPNIEDMMHACKLIKSTIDQAMRDNPDLDKETLRTRFAACQDIEGGNLRIRIYWSARSKEEPVYENHSPDAALSSV